jgi:hypothetical protein
MKISFKKITAIATSVLLVGITMGVAAAANFPSPYESSTSAGVGIVSGSGADVDDLSARGDIATYLATKVRAIGGDVTGGDYALLERATDKFNLLNNMSSFYTKLDEGELSTVLAKGVYSNDAHDDFDYEQEITLGTSLQLTHFLHTDFNDDKPVIGFDLTSGDHLFNYTLKFTPDDAQGTDTSWSGITNSNLPLLGEQYYVLAMTNTSNTNHKITLLNAAVSASLSEGESVTLTAGSTTYEVSVSYIDASNIKLTINGELTDTLQASQTQKLSDGSYVGIKEINWQSIAGGASNVDFSIGSGKLVLENDKEVEINNEKLSKTEYNVVGSDETVSYKVYSYISTSGTDLDSIVLRWDLGDDSWIAPGTEMVLPGFESVKLYMNDFIIDKSELTELKGSSKKFTLSTTLSDGDINLDVFYLNSSSTGIEGLGKDSTHILVTGNGTAAGIGATNGLAINLNETDNSYFVVTWINGDDFESYAYKLGDVDEDNNNRTILENLIPGGTDITLDEVADYDTDGNVKFQLDFAYEKYPAKAYVALNISAASSGNVYVDRIVTAEGLQIRLPVQNDSLTTDGFIDCTGNATHANPTTWTMNFTEEDINEEIAAGGSFTVAMGFSGTDGIQPATIGVGLTTTTMHETYDNSDVFEGYMPTDLATYLSHDKPTSGLNELDITYHGSEAYAEVYVAELGVSAGEVGSMVFTDAEKTSWQSRDVILVGGSCINSATAEALGVTYPTCEAAFTTATGVGSGEYLIKVIAGSSGGVVDSGKIALVVAGYAKADTAAGATYLAAHPNVDTLVDMTAGKEYRGKTGVTGSLAFAEV